jgi:hypothetical protein
MSCRGLLAGFYCYIDRSTAKRQGTHKTNALHDRYGSICFRVGITGLRVAAGSRIHTRDCSQCSVLRFPGRSHRARAMAAPVVPPLARYHRIISPRGSRVSTSIREEASASMIKLRRIAACEPSLCFRED